MIDKQRLQELEKDFKSSQDEAFVKNKSRFVEAVTFIRKNLSPDEVFSLTELRHFYEENKDRLENKLTTQFY